MHSNVINVLTNVDQTQLILPHLPHDGAIINVFLKRHLEYKLPYMSRNVHPNMVMVILRYLIETPLYKDLNVTIHNQWASFFASHMNSKSQIPPYNNVSSNSLILQCLLSLLHLLKDYGILSLKIYRHYMLQD
jgi:hypothetical protein